jgi:hypothetical protein
MENVKKSKPDLFTTPRTGVDKIEAPPIVFGKLARIWGKNDSRKLFELWDLTQVREPYSVEEIEDLFFEGVPQ